MTSFFAEKKDQSCGIRFVTAPGDLVVRPLPLTETIIYRPASASFQSARVWDLAGAGGASRSGPRPRQDWCAIAA